MKSATAPRRGKQKTASTEDILGAIASRLAPRAGSFIVTLYGDVVEPRGLPLWMGSIIEICAAAGISETLVRTAVSRLVAAGRLVGDRHGRRSYYRLTEEARLEFARAAKTLFAPKDAVGWQLIWSPGDMPPNAEQVGFARLGGPWLLGPSDGLKPAQLDPQSVIFDATPVGTKYLAAMVAEQWDLAGWTVAYDTFLDLFAPLSDAMGTGVQFSDSACLQLRLFLVHAYRLAALRDPHLPRDALPPAWSGTAARQVFANLYRGLSPGADRHAASLQSVDGPLPAETDIVRRRRETLRASL